MSEANFLGTIYFFNPSIQLKSIANACMDLCCCVSSASSITSIIKKKREMEVMTMKKRILCLLLAVLFAAALFAGCASSKRTEQAAETRTMAESGWNSGGEAYDRLEGPKSEKKSISGEQKVEADKAANATAVTGSGYKGQTAYNAVLAERKIIRKANVTIEVDNFDEAYSRLNTIILGIGFVAESNINTDRVYVNKEQKLIKRGTIVIRVDRAKFDKVFADVKGLGLVLYENCGTEDVTEKYFDVESRLNLLRLEEERVMQYLRKLEDPDAIFKAESRLTNIRHEIESLTVTLRKLDDLVDLSTITINMNEKLPDSEPVEPIKPVPYGERLLKNFIDSMKGAVNFCGEFIIIIVQVLPSLILIGLFIMLALFIYRKIAKIKSVIKSSSSKNNDSDGIKM